ncbi:MAG: ROK family protein, partial [Acidimicrobiia bacterium]
MSRHVGLDLGGTNIKTAVIERREGDWLLLSTGSEQTGASEGPEAVAANLVAVGSATIAANDHVETLGLGVPGHFDGDTGRILLFPNLPGDWEGFPLRDRVAT